MGALLTAVVTWFLGAFTRLFAVMASNVLATKVILGTLFIVILPIIINNAIYSLMSTMMTTITTFAQAQNPDLESTVSFTGLAAYMLNSLGLIDAFSVVLSAVALRFALTWIPFMGPK